MKRPTSVTVIAWVLILSGGLSLVATLRSTETQRSEVAGWSVVMVTLWAAMSGIIVLVSGMAILKGLNWGRLLYLSFVPISMCFYWLLYGFRPIHTVRIIYYIVFLVFLTRPAASEFFASGNSEESKLEQ